MSISLSDRIANYTSLSNYKLLPKLPVIITVNGRSFTKTTALLEKPYSSRFMEALTATATHLVQEISGTVFAYIFNDEIVLIVRNDQSKEAIPWCENETQKITSTVASFATLFFNTYAASIDLNISNAIFTTNVFVVPNMTEAINTIISKQQYNMKKSIQLSCLYALLEKGHSKNEIEEMIYGSTMDENLALLFQECQIEFNTYPLSFRRGVACYKKPQIVKYENQEIVKNKWFLDVDLPIFTKDTFLQDILKKENT